MRPTENRLPGRLQPRGRRPWVRDVVRRAVPSVVCLALILAGRNDHVLADQFAVCECLRFARCVAGADYVAGEPRVLFDGRDLSAWMSESGGPPAPGWEIEGDTLHLDAMAGRAGNLLSRDQFESFVLCFEWKIAPEGNSGIKYKVRRYDGRILGVEYQILDDPAYPRQKPKGLTASIYDLYAPVSEKPLRPAGRFNSGAIVVRGRHIEHWLNGRLVAQAEIASDDWYVHKSASKFRDVEGFGENTQGRIMLTDHRSEVWYRNIVLVPLSPCVAHLPVAAVCTPGGEADGRCRCDRPRLLKGLLAPLRLFRAPFCRR